MKIEREDSLTIKKLIDNLLQLQAELEDIYPDPVKSIVVSSFALTMTLAEYEGERYFVIPPNELATVKAYIAIHSKNVYALLGWYSDIPIIEDDELGKKIIIAAYGNLFNR